MEIHQLVQVQQKKKIIYAKREKLIHNQLRNKQKNQINLDQSTIKKGFIEKTKIIHKKVFETKVEKSRKIKMDLQPNVNVNTFVAQTSAFSAIINRTTNLLKFDNKTIKEAMMALTAYAKAHYEKFIFVNLRFEKSIDCSIRPCQIQLSRPLEVKKCIIITEAMNENQKELYSKQFKDKNYEIQNLNLGEFKKQFQNDKVLSKQIKQGNFQCFVDFKVYKDNAFLERLLGDGVVVFPIDTMKVPFVLQEKFYDFESYIKDLLGHLYCVTRSGESHQIKIPLLNAQALAQDAETAICWLTSKLIQRSKTKMNKVLEIQAKTASSVNFTLYNSTKQS